MTNESYSFQRLKKQISIDLVLKAYGLMDSLKTKGDCLCGPCPLHGGDNPTAFRVHLERGLWHCFTSCGGGDLVELVRRIEKCNYAEAAGHLHRLVHGELPDRCRSVAPPAQTTPSFRPFRRQLPLDPRSVFLQRHKGIKVSTAVHFEAGSPDKSAFLRNTVAVRLFDLQGNPLGYCGRRLLTEEIRRWGKWRFPRGFPKASTLFNAHRVIQEHGMVIVECPWAVMRLFQAGISQVVALLGTTMSDTQAEGLAASPHLLLLLDGDDAGQRATAAISKQLESVTTTSSYQLPEDCEPEDLTDNQLTAAVNSSLPLSLNQYSASTSRVEGA